VLLSVLLLAWLLQVLRRLLLLLLGVEERLARVEQPILQCCQLLAVEAAQREGRAAVVLPKSTQQLGGLQ
jgi:hypothetical protein